MNSNSTDQSTDAPPFPSVTEDISPHRRPAESAVFERYVGIIRRLRAPGGCPWDRKQSLVSLRRFIVEEAFELLASIHDYDDRNDLDDPAYAAHIAEELGDVILVSTLIADALEKETGITLTDVLRENGEKLVRRHPHVFADNDASTADQVVANWNQIKKEQEGRKDDPGSISAGLPPLERAFEIQNKAAKVGFDWAIDDVVTPIAKIREELSELEERIAEIGAESDPSSAKDDKQIEKEIGDVLFSAVNASRHLKTDPSVALGRSNDVFLTRFRYIDEQLQRHGKTIEESDLSELDRLWDEAKALEFE